MPPTLEGISSDRNTILLPTETSTPTRKACRKKHSERLKGVIHTRRSDDGDYMSSFLAEIVTQTRPVTIRTDSFDISPEWPVTTTSPAVSSTTFEPVSTGGRKIGQISTLNVKVYGVNTASSTDPDMTSSHFVVVTSNPGSERDRMEMRKLSPPPLSRSAIVGIAVAGGIFLLVLVSAFFAFKWRRQKSKLPKPFSAFTGSTNTLTVAPAVPTLPISERYTVQPPVPAVVASESLSRQSNDLRSMSPHSFLKHTSIDTLPEDCSILNFNAGFDADDRPPKTTGVAFPEDQFGPIFFLDRDLPIQSGGPNDAEIVQPMSRAILMARILAPESLHYSYNGSISSTSAPRATVVGDFTPRDIDDLHVGIGQSLRVLVEYDDEWALCANDWGYQGLVPLSCLNNPQG